MDLFAGTVAVGLHDTIKQVDPTANADAAFLLAWAGESNIPSLMTANDPILSQTAESLQSLARDKAIELNRGHAGLGVSGTPVMDEVAFEVPTSLLSAGLPKMLGMGARVSKKISEEGIELVLGTARRLDDEAIEAIWRAGKTLDNADGIPLDKIVGDAPRSAVIRGEAPGVSAWRVNAGGLVRSEDEIAQVLADAGIRVPKDVRFIVGEADEFYGTIDDVFAGRGALTARLGSLTEDAKGFVYFNNQRNRFGQIPIRFSPAMMHSDEAIAAIAKHELVELSLFRREFTRGGGRMTFDAFRAQAMPGNPGNFHSRAWDAADRVIRRLRGE